MISIYYLLMYISFHVNQMEKIRQAVTEMWVPQFWQPPARQMVATIPLQPGGLRGKKDAKWTFNAISKTGEEIQDHIHQECPTYKN